MPTLRTQLSLPAVSLGILGDGSRHISNSSTINLPENTLLPTQSKMKGLGGSHFSKN